MKINNIIEIINQRRSTRSFQIDAITKNQRIALLNFIASIDVPFEHNVESCLFEADATKKLYMIFNAPKDNIAFISETDFISISKAGFIGELTILKATELGLSTCWYGHYNLMEMERLLPHLGKYKDDKHPSWSYGKKPVEGKRIIAISPLAKWKSNGLRLVDRMQFKMISFKRKSISELLIGEVKVEQLSESLLFALDFARKAPSAGNAQFWRFKISPDHKRIEIAMPIGYKHLKWEHPNVDIGITACHLWLGLKEKKINCSISIKEDNNRAVWCFDLR